MGNTNKDAIMKGLFDGTKDLKPMFITGGIDEGIIKYIGEARAKYNPSAVNTPAHWDRASITCCAQKDKGPEM